jgi:hypothetical protein
MIKKFIVVNDKMQTNYRYALTAPIGSDFDPEFKPELSPKEMLEMGVFGGRYMRDCKNEFPLDWFAKAKFHDKNQTGHNEKLNYFEVDASQPLKVWQENGWINDSDPRGWFQWYCRYYMGRRIEDDKRQIKRWKAMKRHVAQITHNCSPKDITCRKKQRQALLHWAYDSRKI